MSQWARCSRPAAQPLRRSGGDAGRRAPGRQSASHHTAKQPSQGALLHQMSGMGQVGKGRSEWGRDMVAYLCNNLPLPTSCGRQQYPR